MTTTSRIVVIIMHLIFHLAMAQETEWYYFQKDHIGIEFPTDEVFVHDTLLIDSHVYAMYAEVDSIMYTMMISKPLSETDVSNNLPTDNSSLNRYYKNFINSFNTGVSADSIDGKTVLYDDYLGYNAKYYDAKGDKLYELNVFLVDVFTVVVGIDEHPSFNSKKSEFFNSLNLSKIPNQSQFSNQSEARKLGQKLGKFILPLLFAIVFYKVFKRSLKKIE